MASIQRFVISFLLILSVAFVFFAQTSEATKGPKITQKVCFMDHVHCGELLMYC